jgi:hypothetical protein
MFKSPCGIAKVVEQLLSKLNALGLISSTEEKKKH